MICFVSSSVLGSRSDTWAVVGRGPADAGQGPSTESVCGRCQLLLLLFCSNGRRYRLCNDVDLVHFNLSVDMCPPKFQRERTRACSLFMWGPAVIGTGRIRGPEWGRSCRSTSAREKVETEPWTKQWTPGPGPLLPWATSSLGV